MSLVQCGRGRALLRFNSLSLVPVAIIAIMLLLLPRKQPNDWSSADLALLKNHTKAMKQCQRILLTLERKFNLDKSISPINYFAPYAQFLCALKNEEVSVLEIGIDASSSKQKDGGNLYKWAQFFPRAASIVGMGVSKDAFNMPANMKMIHANRTNSKLIKKVCEDYGPFDVVVDEVSHINRDTVTAFSLIWNCMKFESIYILEDKQSSQWRRTSSSVGSETNRTAINFFRSLIDEQNFAEIQKYGVPFESSSYAKELAGIYFHPDLIVIEKGNNMYPSSMQIVDDIRVPQHWLY
ncbi:hypothetical protein Tcan_14069 [Toxocara canis]|uniref:Uncharacterized protein n=1 Tax=Toxocara canis TaxID=6265 RepID=A0A0B2VDV8_TOXCA|nr:hypothetical protein Tcan_14069 [Toxocara canis]